MTELYNLPNIRELLTNGFSDAELRALCFDLPGFRPVHDQLAQNTGTVEIVAKLLEHTEKTLQLDTLLALAREKNLARYEKHQPYYVGDAVPSLQKEVVNLIHRLSVLNSLVSLNREQQYQVALHWAELGCRDSLAHFDLSERDLRAVDLSGADLRGANLTMANLNKADLCMANLSKTNLTEANLIEANLYRANLNKAYCSEADLKGANLSKTDLIETCLCKSNLEGTKFQNANLSSSTMLSFRTRILAS